MEETIKKILDQYLATSSKTVTIRNIKLLIAREKLEMLRNLYGFAQVHWEIIELEKEIKNYE